MITYEESDLAPVEDYYLWFNVALVYKCPHCNYSNTEQMALELYEKLRNDKEEWHTTPTCVKCQKTAKIKYS